MAKGLEGILFILLMNKHFSMWSYMQNMKEAGEVIVVAEYGFGVHSEVEGMYAELAI